MVAASVPVAQESNQAVLLSLLETARSLGAAALTEEEEYWLADGNPGLASEDRAAAPRGVRGALDRTQLSSSVLECIRGSGPCLELGDRAAQSWPPGGTGRPIAVSSVSSLQDEILIKMIIGVDHGAMDIKVPCNMQPFSFGSGPPPFALQPYPGFYSHPKTKVLASRREAAKGLGLLAETIARDLARLYCSDRRSSDRVEANFVLSEAVGCVVSATESLALLDNGVSEMDAAIGSNEEETRRSIQPAPPAMLLSRDATPLGGDGSDPAGDGEITERRVVLRPGTWKIRARVDRPAYLVYHFSLGANWTTADADDVFRYPNCSRAACEGLSRHERGCDSSLERGRLGVRSFDCRREHSRGADYAMDSMESGLPLSHSPDQVDVMMDHRALIEETRAAAISTVRRFAARGTEDGVVPLRSTGKFLGRMNSWKSARVAALLPAQLATLRAIGCQRALARLRARRVEVRQDGLRPWFPSRVLHGRASGESLAPIVLSLLRALVGGQERPVEPRVSLTLVHGFRRFLPGKQDLLAGQEHVERLAVRLQGTQMRQERTVRPSGNRRRHPGRVRRQADGK
ncbi:hypothetical protein Q5P01_000734 [Channa striata]|uniref:Uncharacterized protein n=1 Tax=Channa striata TaxID=64152 RepID=A0AA88LMA1_CHASR|nr:hypothetical protein Q5P01_000734 [Channa striata]